MKYIESLLFYLAGASTALESAHPICKTSSLIGERQNAFDDQVRLLNFSGQLPIIDELYAF